MQKSQHVICDQESLGDLLKKCQLLDGTPWRFRRSSEDVLNQFLAGTPGDSDVHRIEGPPLWENLERKYFLTLILCYKYSEKLKH